MAPSANLHLQDDPFTDDSDTEPDSPAAAHYLPITADSDSDSDDNDVITPVHLNGSIANHPNPSSPHIENGVAELHLDGSEGAEEEEVVEREEEVTVRAFTEDESRRSAPLAPEAAARIVDAMRGVSFQGVRPVWLEEVPEERWVDQLRRLRDVAEETRYIPRPADPVRQRVTYVATAVEPDDSHICSPWFQVHPVLPGDPIFLLAPELEGPPPPLPPPDTTKEQLRACLEEAYRLIGSSRQIILSQTRRARESLDSMELELTLTQAHLREYAIRVRAHCVNIDEEQFLYPGSQTYMERYQPQGDYAPGGSGRYERGVSSRGGYGTADEDE